MAREALSYTDRFFSYSIDMLCIAGFDGYFKIINPAWEKTLGWTAQELLSRPWNDFVHPDDLEATNLVKSSIAEGQTVFQFENRYRCKDGSFKWLSWNSFPNMEEQRIYSVARDITLLKDAEEKNRCIDWMVNTKETRSKETKKKNYVPEYGNLTLLNKNGLIKQSIDKTLLTDIANDYLSLLETSSAIYEKNGDYALGIFSSGWCQFMDRASRNLCETPENREALSGGKWLCHESCWTDASQKAIDQNKAFDIECNGGIHIYAVPILAGKQVIGAINFGYGDPPSDDETLHLLANKYKVDFTELKKRALSYESRPPFIIGLAKERLHSSARLIGTLIERKMAQDALKESQKSALDTARLLEGVFNAIPDILGIQDAYHRMIRYNEAGYKSLNIKEGSEKNHHCYELIGRSRPCKDCATSIVLKTKKAAQIEKYVPEWDTWFEARSYPILDEKGNITLIIEHLRDITQRKKSEETINTLTQAIDQSPDSVVTTNTKGEIEYVNPALEKISGYSMVELLGQNPRIFSSGKTPEEVYQDLWRSLSKGKTWKGEFENRKKNGDLFWESATISPITNAIGEITHYLAIREDISGRKKMENELIRAKEKAEESDRLKSSFLANLSHEIRTPMNSIMGFASLLPEEESSVLIQQYANIIVRNSEQLVHIIDDIVLYSRLQTKMIPFTPSRFTVGELFTDLVQSFRLPEYQNNGIELMIDPLCDPNQEVISDYEKLRQIFTNLISNAFKYTCKGFITLGYVDGITHGIFSVEDTGMGIPEQEKEKIFDRFYRGSNVNTGRISGTGLGLSIVKELTSLLGGNIGVESQPGKGSTFRVTLKR